MEARTFDRTRKKPTEDPRIGAPGVWPRTWAFIPRRSFGRGKSMGFNPMGSNATWCPTIQALDRKDPVPPLSPGRAERHAFEYIRRGTLSLIPSPSSGSRMTPTDASASLYVHVFQSAIVVWQKFGRQRGCGPARRPRGADVGMAALCREEAATPLPWMQRRSNAGGFLTQGLAPAPGRRLPKGDSFPFPRLQVSHRNPNPEVRSRKGHGDTPDLRSDIGSCSLR